MKKKLFITYSWIDNKNSDVDYIAQEIEKKGIMVIQGKHNLQTEKILWEQIDKFISESDAWMIYATQASLTSKARKEELFTALDKALDSRLGEYPLIGLFSAHIDRELIPWAIRKRVYTNLEEPDWLTKITDGVEQRNSLQRKVIEPYYVAPYYWNGQIAGFEFRPRAGEWSPFIISIPESYELATPIYVAFGLFGQNGRIGTSQLYQKNLGVGTYPNDKRYIAYEFNNIATPTQSYYINFVAIFHQSRSYLGLMMKVM